MTHDEVVAKWSRKHLSALKDVLRLIETGETTIVVPKKQNRNMVTSQIFKDFGYSLVKVGKYEGKKAFFTYKKDTN